MKMTFSPQGAPRGVRSAQPIGLVMAVLVLALGGACAHAYGKDDRTICAEDRGQRCLAGQTCAMDKQRGCELCQCRPAGNTGPDGNPTLPR
jgi:hypothetical protein